MKLSRFFALAIESGIENDPRGKAALKKLLPNPYADSRILAGNPHTEVRRILAGIDIEVAELLLADRLRQQGGVDLVLSHHPEGKAWAVFYEVMRVQVDMLKNLGVPADVAEALLEERKAEVARRLSAANHSRAVDAARLLDIPFACTHTPADNCASRFIYGLIEKNKPKKIRDLLEILNTVPEYKIAGAENNPPVIISGSAQRPVGKIYVEMTGGTEGPKKIYDKIYKLGVRTLVGMHLSEEHLAAVRNNSFNVVIAGHIASDNLGMNLLLDSIEKKAKEELQVISCSGFRRIRHYHG